MTEGTSAPCQWCERPFQARRGGSAQRFCGTKCRTMFWSALRRSGERALAAGVVTISDIRRADPAACTLPGAAISPPPVGLLDAAEIVEDKPFEAQPRAEPAPSFEVDSAWLWGQRLTLWQRWKMWAPNGDRGRTRMAAERRVTSCDADLSVWSRLRLGQNNGAGPLPVTHAGLSCPAKRESTDEQSICRQRFDDYRRGAGSHSGRAGGAIGRTGTSVIATEP
jgi:hypothetical protein